MQDVVALASGLSSSEMIKVTNTLAICPMSVLQGAVRKAAARLVEAASFPSKVWELCNCFRSCFASIYQEL